MKTFMWLVGAVIIAWLVLSPLVWGYWYTKDVETQRSRGWGYLVGLGAFISCVYVLTEGIHAGLSFMPDSWGGYDEDGEYVTMRRSISFTGGLLGSLALMDLMGRAKRNRLQR